MKTPEKSLNARLCAHCGTVFTPKNESEIFCCAGCARVAENIQADGLGEFYKIKNRPLSPVSAGYLEKRNWAWLDEVVAAAERGAARGQRVSAVFDVQGISCVACVWIVEKIFRRIAGGVAVEVNPSLGRLVAHWQAGCWDASEFATSLQEHGYLLGSARKGLCENTSRRLLTKVGITGALAMNAMLFTIPFYMGLDSAAPHAGLFRAATVLLATGSFFVGGIHFLKRAWSAIKMGAVHMDLPIALGILAAYVGSLVGWWLGVEKLIYFDFVAMFTFLMLLGRWVQEAAVEHNRNRLLQMTAEPEKVLLIKDGKETQVPVSELRKGDVFLTNAGAAIPVSAVLDSQAAVLSLEWINGESDFRNWKRGRRAPAGAVQLSRQPVRWIAEQAWADSLLARLLERNTKAKRDQGVESFLRGYLSLVIIIALSGAGAWFAGSGDFVRAFQVALSVLVVSCPCAMGVALPFAGELAVSSLRRRGLYVRVPDFWSRFHRVKTVVFDKTGTLTLSTRQLKQPEVLDKLSAVQRTILAKLVEESLHPVSRSLREELLCFKAEQLADVGGCAVEEIAGLGVRMWFDNSLWSLGKPGWSGGIRNDHDVDVGGYSLDADFCCDGRVLCQFSFTETLRNQARELMFFLRRNGYRIQILSGDSEEKVRLVAQELELRDNEFIGGLSPEHKARWIRENSHAAAMMIGDGVNDSLAFDEAVVTGTAVADTSTLQGKSDFYFLGTNLHGLRELFSIAKLRRSAVCSAFIFASLYNLAAVGVSLAGWMSPLLAAILMPISSVITLGIVLFSYRRYQPK